MGAISAGALARRLAGTPCGVALLDIREAGEAETGHIPGATSLPRRVIEFLIDDLLPARGTPVVVYDGGLDDGRAGLAAETLAGLGYHDVLVLTGGIAAWRQAARPVATGVNVPSKRFGERLLGQDGVASITPAELGRWQATGALFEQWDVRTPAEFARATLPGSRSVPGVEIAVRTAEARRRGIPVVVHCAGRTRSIVAARTLTLLGVERVLALENGTMGWRLSGRGLVPGQDGLAPGPSDAGPALALAAAAGVRALSPGELAAALASRAVSGLVAVDVRDERAVAAGRIQGSVARPGGQLLQCTDETLVVQRAPVVLVDDGDGRAAVTAYWLRRMGFPDVEMLEGGIPAWRAAGLPLVSGPLEPPSWLAVVRGGVSLVATPGTGGDASPLVLDVGTSRAFRAGHLPGAAWLPRGWLEAKIASLAGRDRTIVVSASDEAQALLATATLRRLGYAAACLAGGNPGWVSRGGRLEGADTLPLTVPPDLVDPPYAKGEAGMRAYLAWEIALTEGGTASHDGGGEERTPPDHAP